MTLSPQKVEIGVAAGVVCEVGVAPERLFQGFQGNGGQPASGLGAGEIVLRHAPRLVWKRQQVRESVPPAAKGEGVVGLTMGKVVIAEMSGGMLKTPHDDLQPQLPTG